jgi:hypothetical protein
MDAMRERLAAGPEIRNGEDVYEELRRLRVDRGERDSELVQRG